MKSKFVRTAILLTLALGLSACGGKAKFTVAGPIAGLSYAGLVLTNNGSDLSVAANSTSYSFPNTVDYGNTYDVSVKTNPLHQTCLPYGANSAGHLIDTAGRMASISVPIVCSLNNYSIGGTVTGLTADGLVLTNGSSGGTVTLAKDVTAFTFSATVPYGVSYGVTVLTQPTNGTVICSVGPTGTGVMGDAAVTNIAITCVPKT